MKFREVVVSDESIADLDEGKAYYDARELGVGEYFIDSLLADLESLAFYAGIHVKQYGYFRLLSKRFPFAIYYEIVSSSVMIVAILDMRRNPTWLRAQLETRTSIIS
jgi:hypothetical protein